MKNIINELINIAKAYVLESSADNRHALIEKFSFERANVPDKSEIWHSCFLFVNYMTLASYLTIIFSACH